ncbi:MAG: polysaccharide biosynthesis/export family protein [Limisphaerales bacterium]
MKLFRNLFVLCAGVCASLFFTACATTDSGAGTGGSGSVAVAPKAPLNNGEWIRKGEQLTIELLDISPPSKIEQAVADDGTITLPLLTDRVKAEGKKDTELANDIHDLYVPRYYRRMTVNIKRENRFYFVGGQVKNPTQRQYTGDMTLLRAIKSAGDFTDYADRRNVIIIRSNGTREKVDVKAIIKNPKKDVPIYPGDTVDVPLRLY